MQSISDSISDIKIQMADFSVGGGKYEGFQASFAEKVVAEQETLAKYQAEIEKATTDEKKAELKRQIEQIQSSLQKNAEYIQLADEEIQRVKKLNEMDELSRMVFLFEEEKRIFLEHSQAKINNLLSEASTVQKIYENQKNAQIANLEILFQETLANRAKIEGVNQESLKKVEELFKQNMETIKTDLLEASNSNELSAYISKMREVIEITKEAMSVSGSRGSIGSRFQASGYAFANGGVFNGFGVSGIVNSPVMGLAGEAGPEAIVPLPDGRSIPVKMQGGGSGRNIVVNISVGGSVISERELVDTVSARLASVLSSQGVFA
jgi:hypothetical protein